MKRMSLLLFAVLVGAAFTLIGQEQKAAKEADRPLFLPKPLDDHWTQWIVGQWEGVGESTAGKGKGRCKIELGLSGQFLITTGEAEIIELDSDYLKKKLYATDEEIQQFRSSPYKSLEISTVDPKTGEVVAYLFDSLRCVATGRGKRQENKEIIQWQWSAQGVGTSTRIMEKVDNDKILAIQKYTLPNGAVMEDRGEMIRCKKPAGTEVEKK